MMPFHFLTLAVLVALGQVGCSGGHDHDHSHAEPHYHEPPHGGAGVTLGDEAAHIEFLVDAGAGSVTAWFFTPHMERYLRIPCLSEGVRDLRCPMCRRKGMWVGVFVLLLCNG